LITVHLHTILQIETPAGMVRRLETDLPPGGSIGDLVEMLNLKLPPDSMIFLVNGRTQREEYMLADGDEVNLIPALYGGA
jgi:molybdopterin converting factor small subunit